MKNRIHALAHGLFRLSSLSLLASLVACGGGSSGSSSGGGGGGGTLTFSADKTSVSMQYTVGDIAPSEAVTVTATGNYTGTLYVAALVEGQGIDPNIPVALSGTKAIFTLHANSTLSGGTYTGRVKLLGCSDNACKTQIGNSPIVVNYTVTVIERLTVSPGSITATGPSDIIHIETVSAQLSNGQTNISTQVTGGAEWITVTNPAAGSFQLSFASLPTGSYYGSVRFYTGASEYLLTVYYSVYGGQDQYLAANPTSIALGALEGTSGTPAMLTVTPPSWDPMTSATAEGTGSPSWLTIAPVAGGYQLTGSGVGLISGTYNGTVRLHGAYPSTDVLVPVSLTVGQRMLDPPDVTLVVQAETTPAQLGGSVPVDVVTGPPTSWSATASPAWLQVVNSSGNTGQALNFTVDPAAVAALANGSTMSGTLTITPTMGVLSPVSVQVSVNKALPLVTRAAPHVHASGQNARVVVRGSGFAAIANPAARFSVQGATVSGATRVNDTEVVISLSAMSAGTHSVSVSNALGEATASGAIVVVDVPSYGYSALPTGGTLRSLAYDAERDALLAVNGPLESVMKFSHSGAGWATTSVALPSAYDVGLVTDGSRLLVTTDNSSTSSIRQLDPTTLAQTAQFDPPSTLVPFGSAMSYGIQTTNDERSWFGLDNFPGSDQWAAPAVYDAAANTFTKLELPVPSQYTFHGGPWYAMSRDGERLLIVQSSDTSPAPPMLYMDAAVGTFQVNPAGLQFSYNFSLSDDGDRVLFDMYEVRDLAFSLIGHADLPASNPAYFAMKGFVSHDGGRAYVVAYRSDADSPAAMAVRPRVFVFDSSTRQTLQTSLPVLGYFDLPDYPTCYPLAVTASCSLSHLVGAVSLDDNTLFIGGNNQVLIVPIPQTLNPVAMAPSAPVKPVSGGPSKVTPWVLGH